MKHVFVSSTFKDMQFERDALHTFAAVNINEKLSPYGEEVYFGDLRWGVNTTSLDSDDGCRRVLEVCLDEIDDCRPYMIVLVGERYGWIPDDALIRDAASVKGIDICDGMSVTQLEIEYGALLSDERRGRVFFYFRELDTTGMTEEQRADYLAESELHRGKIEALKSRIREIYPDAVRTYTARFDAESQRVIGLQDFLDAVVTDLSAAFLSDLEAEESLPWQERAIRSAGRHYLELSQNYHPAERRPLTLLDGTFAADRTLMQFVKGDSGTGKSAFLAHNFSVAASDGDERELLPFVLGLDKYSTCENDYFKLLLYKLEELAGEAHMETYYGEAAFDTEIFDRILRLEKNAEGTVHSFIDNCSYELQNTLSVRILDRYLLSCDVGYFAGTECSSDHLDFMIAYSADEEAVILPPWFDYSRTYFLNNVSEDDQIPLVKMLLRQKHKELDDSVIAAITQKEQASSPFYLKLAVERMLMLDSGDFSEIRAMGDGMDNINRYQLSVVNALPETTAEMAAELVYRVGKRVNMELVMRLMGILTYGAVRMNENFIESVFSTRGWAYSSLDFALATRSLSAVLNYNPKDKSYAVVNPDAIEAFEKLLADEGYSYVAQSLYDHITKVADGALSDTLASALFRAASYASDDLLFNLYVSERKNETYLAKETGWLIRRRGAEFTAEVLTRAADGHPEIDFSFILSGIPTACLTIDDREPYETLLQTILDKFEMKSHSERDINRNSFAVIAWTKLVSIKMKVNTSEAAPIFHKFIDEGKRDYPMRPRARIMLDTVYYRFLALEAYYSMRITTPESDLPASVDLLDELDSFEEKLLLSSHLFSSFSVYLRRAFDPSHSEYYSLAKRGYETLFEYLKNGELEHVTADDVAMMIDCMLDDSDDMLHTNTESISAALGYMTAGQTHVNSRLLKYLPRILEAAKYSFDTDKNDFSEETVNIIRRLCATSRAVAGGAVTVDDFLYAAVQMEQSYDILSERISANELLALITHLDKFVKMILSNSNGDPRIFYRCYLSIRRLFSIFELFSFDDAKNSLLGYISSLEIEDPSAPILPELFIGSLLFTHAHPENEELRDHLRSLLETVEREPEYASYTSAYSPELMYLKIDLRTPEEIAADNELMFSSGTDKSDGEFDEDDDSDFDDVADDIDQDNDEDDGDDSEDDFDDDDYDFDDVEDDIADDEDDISDIADGDIPFSIDEMIAFLEEQGISIDELLSDDEE